VVPITYLIVAALYKYEFHNPQRKYLNFNPDTLEKITKNEVN